MYKLYRRTAARLNYLSLDRIDIAFATREVCMRVNNPTQGDVADIKRPVRYLRGVPGLVYTFLGTEGKGWRLSIHGLGLGLMSEDVPWHIRVCVYVGQNLIHFHSRTQVTISLSSAEAELVASVLATQEGLLAWSILGFWRRHIQVLHVHGDSSAARGVLQRQGAGRIKHLTLKQLRVQDYVQAGTVVPHRAPRVDNPPDLLTHHWAAAEWTNLGRYVPTSNALDTWPRGETKANTRRPRINAATGAMWGCAKHDSAPMGRRPNLFEGQARGGTLNRQVLGSVDAIINIRPSGNPRAHPWWSKVTDALPCAGAGATSRGTGPGDITVTTRPNNHKGLSHSPAMVTFHTSTRAGPPDPGGNVHRGKGFEDTDKREHCLWQCWGKLFSLLPGIRRAAVPAKFSELAIGAEADDQRDVMGEVAKRYPAIELLCIGHGRTTARS